MSESISTLINRDPEISADISDAELKEILGLDKEREMGPYLTKDGRVIAKNDESHDQYQGMKVGLCAASMDSDTAYTLSNVSLSRAEIERIGAIARIAPDSFRLAPDVYDGATKGFRTGHICWPFRNGLTNDLVLKTDCEEIFPDDDDKCKALKEGITSMSGQPAPKPGWQIVLEEVRGPLETLAIFGPGLHFYGKVIQGGQTRHNNRNSDDMNGLATPAPNNNQPPNGKDGAGEKKVNPSVSEDFDFHNVRPEFSRQVELIKNGVPKETYQNSGYRQAVSWGASFALGAAAYFAAGLIADAGVAVVDIAADGLAAGGEMAVGAASGVGAWYWNVVWGL